MLTPAFRMVPGPSPSIVTLLTRTLIWLEMMYVPALIRSDPPDVRLLAASLITADASVEENRVLPVLQFCMNV